MTADPVEWTCHVCGAIRRDEDIMVRKIERTDTGVRVIENVRYCADRTSCRSMSNLGHKALAERRQKMRDLDLLPSPRIQPSAPVQTHVSAEFSNLLVVLLLVEMALVLLFLVIDPFNWIK